MKNQGTKSGSKKDQIFKTNFESELRPKVVPRSIRIRSRLFTSVSIVIVVGAYICHSVFAAMVLPDKEMIFGNSNPISLTKNISDTVKQEQDIEITATGLRKSVEETVISLDNLQSQNTSSEYPNLNVAFDLRKKKVNWHRAFVGIDQVIRQVVSANDIVKKVTVSVVQFQSYNKSIIIDGLRAFGPYYGETETTLEGSSISLATSIVDAFEQSPFFKDLKVEEYTRNTRLDGETISEFFTPLVLQFAYQDVDEVHVKDKKDSLQDTIQETLPQSSSGSLFTN